MLSIWKTLGVVSLDTMFLLINAMSHNQFLRLLYDIMSPNAPTPTSNSYHPRHLINASLSQINQLPLSHFLPSPSPPPHHPLTHLHIIASSKLLTHAARSKVPYSQHLVLAGLKYGHLATNPLEFCDKIARSTYDRDRFASICVPETH